MLRFFLENLPFLSDSGDFLHKDLFWVSLPTGFSTGFDDVVLICSGADSVVVVAWMDDMVV
jgi:hypothetical protein